MPGSRGTADQQEHAGGNNARQQQQQRNAAGCPPVLPPLQRHAETGSLAQLVLWAGHCRKGLQNNQAVGRMKGRGGLAGLGP